MSPAVPVDFAVQKLVVLSVARPPGEALVCPRHGHAILGQAGMFTWAAVNFSLSLPTQWLTSWRTTMNKYLLTMFVVMALAGLAGCAGPSDWNVQFFKAHEAGYPGLRIMTVSQTDQAPLLPK